jgi:hypothetical protein
MTKDDFITLAIFVVAILLLFNSFMRFWESWTDETELTIELNLLNAEEKKEADCFREVGCEPAIWKLTIESKRSDIYRALAADRSEKKYAVAEAVLTLAGVFFIFSLYSELLDRLRFRIGKPRGGLRTT